MKSLKVFLFSLLLLPFCLAAQGKESEPLESDPLKKPFIWKQLKSNPSNEALWIAYFGKDLFDFSDKEYENFTAWKNQLIKERDRDIKPIKNKTEVVKRKYYEQVYGKIKDPYYQNLITNISSNFLMIEEYFYEQFSFYNNDYTFYSDKYPKGKYDKEQWISEQEKMLEKIRSEQ